MKILVTNDDGVLAPGITVLANVLSTRHEVVVVAPDRERSAASHSITMHQPITAKKMKLAQYHTKEVFGVNGTPADCAKIGVTTLYPKEFDLVVSGINFGANLGFDVMYSGTVHAAIDACMNGVPAYAFSQAISRNIDEAELEALYERDARIALEIIEKNHKDGVYLWNINFPQEAKHKDIVLCPQGENFYRDVYEKRVDPMGRDYYWISGHPVNNINAQQGTDIGYIKQGNITVTPIKWHFTDTELLKNGNFNV